MALTRNHVKLNRFEALESYDLTWLQNDKIKEDWGKIALESYDLTWLQKLNLARICKKHALELYSSTWLQKNGEYIQWKI